MAAEGFEPGRVVELAPGVRRITAGNGGFMTGPGTNTYLVGTEEVVVIDPGPADEAHLAAVAEAAAGRAARILVTHNHPDHSRGARALAERLEVPVAANDTPLSGVQDRNFSADRTLVDGDRVRLTGHTLRAVHTPGHAADHLCFLLEETGLLFAGDHVMEHVTVVIAPPDGDMTAYLDSLARLEREPVRAIAPGHGGLMHQPVAVFAGIREHRLARERQVLEALAAGPTSVDAMVSAFYPEVPKALHAVAGWQIYAHLLKLRREGRVTGEDAAGALWRLAKPEAAGSGS